MMASQQTKRLRTIGAQLRSWLGVLLAHHITTGAQMSPTTLKLLLTIMTLVTVASEKGKTHNVVFIYILYYSF
jgi:hypothetical protein